MQQPQLPRSNPPPAPTHERPERKRSKLMRVVRGYLMIAGGAITLYGLARLVTALLIAIRSTQP